MPRLPADIRYEKYGPEYHKCRMCQDLEHTLVSVLRDIVDPAGLDVVEMGAGTGPITLALLPHVASIVAYDKRQHMVETARANLSASGYTNWHAAVGDHRSLPHRDNSADLVVAAFTLGPMVTVEREGDWKGALDTALSEMHRILRPNGVVAIFEGVWSGEAPIDNEIAHPWFRAEVEYLEQRYGFRGKRFRCDNDFTPLKNEPDVVEMMFGEDGMEWLAKRNWIYPEYDGMWWKRMPVL